MTQSDSKSSTADRDLSLYQLHSRYARLAGLSMEELSHLWHDMKGVYPTRESHMAALFSRGRDGGPGMGDVAGLFGLETTVEMVPPGLPNFPAQLIGPPLRFLVNSEGLLKWPHT